MKRLGYTQFVGAGRRLGRADHRDHGRAAPPELIAIHTNMAATVPPKSSTRCVPATARRRASAEDEQRAYERLDFFFTHGLAYAQRWGSARRRSTGSRIRRSASPPGSSTMTSRATEMIARVFDGEPEGLTRDDVLDNITIYLADQHGDLAARLYWETLPRTSSARTRDVTTIPVAVSAFPDEL